MYEKNLHIISFSVPFPANYGGVIDVFYKLKALYKAGVNIHLHCFQYDRAAAIELEKFCVSVNYYPRKSGILSQLSILPYIVKSRQSDALLKNLLQDNYPILFEGLHSCFYLNHKLLRNRKLLYRESNIEHHYYYNLSKAEKNPIRKLYFLIESAKLLLFQKQLDNASKMLVVSQTDCDYLRRKFPVKDVVYIPSFHGNEEVVCLPGKSDYVLYHGNLSVSENAQAAHFLIEKVFKHISQKLIIAGLNPDEDLKKAIFNHSNIELIANPIQEKMDELISHAHINILITFQPTGLKLKLINTLFRGRYVIVNSNMLAGTGLKNLCIVKETAQEIQNAVKEYMENDFDMEQVQLRSNLLLSRFSDQSNAIQLIKEVFD